MLNFSMYHRSWKRFFSKILGVTLLEIMLVLAIAAMIIVMSVRYYQSATASQQANGFIEQIFGIIAAANSLSDATNSFSKITTSAIVPLLPKAGLKTPWGADISINFQSGGHYCMKISKIPVNVCPLIINRLNTNHHITDETGGSLEQGDCGGGTTYMAMCYTNGR